MTEKPRAWLGSSLDDVRAVPAEAKRAAHAFEKDTRQTRDADVALARKRLADFLRLREQKRKKAR